jgi:hypothetical protein
LTPAGTLTLVGDIEVDGSMTVGDADLSLYGADRDEIDYNIDAPIRAGGVVVRMGHDITDGTPASEDPLITAGTVSLTARTGGIGGSGNADLDLDVSRLRASAGGNLYIEERNNLQASGGISAGGAANLLVHGNLSGDRVSAGKDLTILANGDISVSTLSARNAMDLDGRSMRFDLLTARRVDADAAGSIYVGKANVGELVDFSARESILDNNSMITAPDVILAAGGDIGGETINLDVERISGVTAGGRVQIIQHHEGLTPLGLVSAGRDFHIEVPNGGFKDGNGAALNLAARDNSYLGLRDTCGGRCSPLQVEIIGGNLGVMDINRNRRDESAGNTWISLEGNISVKSPGDGQIEYLGKGEPPGLVILNDNIEIGTPAAGQKVSAAKGFSIETPDLRSRLGIFGSPYFLYTCMQVNEPASLGLVDYILHGQAQVNTDPEFPRIAKRKITMWPEGYVW